jgi:hypothetical protein
VWCIRRVMIAASWKGLLMDEKISPDDTPDRSGRQACEGWDYMSNHPTSY